MWKHILMFLMIVKLQFWTVTMTSPQLFYVNNSQFIP